jgi:hypothetical protein
MLAVVDDFSNARVQVGGGAPAQIVSPFDQRYAKARFSESAGCAHACHAAAYNGHGAV